MFPNFTGTSRRPRNVNLSGQRHKNPFTAHALTPGTGAGASKTVADAQAERQKRQQERNELKAARSIQRVWRSHRVRADVKDARRQSLRRLYSGTSDPLPDGRIAAGVPLLLGSFDASRDDDCQLLDLFAKDVTKTNYAALASGQIPPARLWYLAKILILSLTRRPVLTDQLELLVRIANLRPSALLDSLDLYYRLMVKLCSDGSVSERETLLVRDAVIAPLLSSEKATDESRAYFELATTFLTHPLILLEQNIALFAQYIDIGLLSRTVIQAYSTPKSKPDKSSEQLLWLLAHVIDIQRNQEGGSQSSPLYLKAVYMQLSGLASVIRVRLSADISETSDLGSTSPFGYTAAKVRSLADKNEVAWLLEKFASSQSDASATNYASFLAGYFITLIRCFPDKADDIRMRLFLADFPTPTGPEPAVRYFWTASSSTKLFDRILSSPKSARDFLLQRKYFPVTSMVSADDSEWDREWRTVLLFLELYTFVIRLTDDDDFFSNIKSPALIENSVAAPSRLRSSALNLEALERLSLFLKNLAFALNYNAAELLQDRGNDGKALSTTNGLSRSDQSGGYHVIAGVDFGTFKSLVTTSIQMLYERDSRRQFLPAGHWLMTSNFDMEGFLSAVVLEEQRQHDLRDQDGSDDDVNMDGTSSDDSGSDNLGFHHLRSRASQLAYREKVKKQSKKTQWERMLASIGPKLEILRNMPYALPFDIRVKIFRQFVDLDKQRRRKGFVDPDQWRMFMASQQTSRSSSDGLSRHNARIRRDAVFDTAMAQFFPLGEGLKEPIQITFLDEYGNEEAGIDGGGVTKEFLMSVTKDVFTPAQGMVPRFESNKESALYPNPLALDQLKNSMRRSRISEGSADWHGQISEMLREYEFIGRIVGKCLYEGILLDVVFAGFFLLKWAMSTTDSAYRASINDLREMDEGLYQGMLSLKNYDGNVADMDLNFTLEDQVTLGDEPLRTETRRLMPNGENIPVTNENRLLYISYATRHRLVAQPYQVTKAFLRGLGTIIDPAWLRMFNQNELQRLVGGDSSEIDVADLRKHTVYGGVYAIGDDGEEHPSVKLFWRVMEALPDEDRRLLLKFVTSTPRAPLLGFSQLKPYFSIRDGGSDETRLPSASTCINLLKLPRYSNMETMRKKLLYAVRSNSRFDLS